MSQASNRSRRIGEQIQRELAQIIQQELNDPQLRWVTVAAVKVCRDLAHATVYVTALNQQPDAHNRIIAKLNDVSGYLRHELGRRIRLRILPQLRFIYDESIEHGNQLEKLIHAAVESDNKSNKN